MAKNDIWIFKELNELQRLVVAGQANTNARFDQVDRALALIAKEIDDLGVYVTPELEREIRRISARAMSIDEKVSDTEVGKTK